MKGHMEMEKEELGEISVRTGVRTGVILLLLTLQSQSV